MLSAVALAMASSGPAHATLTPPWSNASVDDTITDFDTGTLLFPTILGRSITIVNPVDGYYHDHDNGCSSTLEVHLNGTWTLVRTGPVSNDVDQLLSTFGKVSFAAGNVDGVRLGSTCFVSNAYHAVNPAMQFDIAAGGPVIPTLSEAGLLALAALMLAAGGFALRRSR